MRVRLLSFAGVAAVLLVSCGPREDLAGGTGDRSPGAARATPARTGFNPVDPGNVEPTPGATGGTTQVQGDTTQAVRLGAQNRQFNPSNLTVPANAPFSILFDNRDQGPHTVSIYRDAAGQQAVFKGKSVDGPTTFTYDVGALSPGSYHLRCDVHPTQMRGTVRAS